MCGVNNGWPYRSAVYMKLVIILCEMLCTEYSWRGMLEFVELIISPSLLFDYLGVLHI